MWILCCGMNRSGSILQYNIAVKVAQERPKAYPVGWVSPADTEAVFGHASDADDERHIVKLHHYDQSMDNFWQKFQPKAIYIYRDLRDVVVSFMNMEGWAFDSPEIETRVFNVLKYYRAWTHKPGILISRYEEVMAEGGLAAEVKKIAAYMEVDLTVEQVQRIAASVNLKANKRYIETFDYEHKGIQYPNTVFDPVSLLHDKHIHSGAVGQWRTALTPEQITIVETWAGDWLEERGYSVQPRSDRERLVMLRDALEAVEEKYVRQVEVISGLHAYIKRVEQVQETAKAESMALAQQMEQKIPTPGERNIVLEAQISALSERNNVLEAQISTLRQRNDALEAQISGVRERKIARIMHRIGRPLI